MKMEKLNKSKLPNEFDAPEDTRILETLLVEDETDFWQAASSISLDEIWDNDKDDVYAEILEA